MLAVGRSGTGRQDPKLREVIHADLFDLSALESELTGFDACFFSVGVSSAGMEEERYRRLTYDLTLAVAQTLGEAQSRDDIRIRVGDGHGQH